jgi:hypothetical protein
VLDPNASDNTFGLAIWLSPNCGATKQTFSAQARLPKKKNRRNKFFSTILLQ